MCLTLAAAATTNDVTKRNWSSVGVRGAWGKRSTVKQNNGAADFEQNSPAVAQEEEESPVSHYIIFTHDDFNSKYSSMDVASLLVVVVVVSVVSMTRWLHCLLRFSHFLHRKFDY